MELESKIYLLQRIASTISAMESDVRDDETSACYKWIDKVEAEAQEKTILEEREGWRGNPIAKIAKEPDEEELKQIANKKEAIAELKKIASKL